MRKKAGKSGASGADSEKHSLEYYLLPFGRFCAWALLVFITLYFLSGFGMTRSGLFYRLTGGLLNRGIALQIHELLVLPAAFTFISHALIAIRFAMIRWNVKNKKILNWVFLCVGVLLFALVCYAYFT